MVWSSDRYSSSALPAHNNSKQGQKDNRVVVLLQATIKDLNRNRIIRHITYQMSRVCVVRKVDCRQSYGPWDRFSKLQAENSYSRWV